MPGWADKWKDRGKELPLRHLCVCEWKQQLLQAANQNTGGSSVSSAFSSSPLPECRAKFLLLIEKNPWCLLAENREAKWAESL